MTNQNQIRVRIRAGLAEPVGLDLDAQDVAQVAGMPVEAGIQWMARKSDATEAFFAAVARTLATPGALIEFRSGDKSRFLKRTETGLAPIKQLPAEAPRVLDIIITTPLAGGIV
jgi:hypothetical protein